MVVIKCSKCGEKKILKGRGLCNDCYMYEYRENNINKIRKLTKKSNEKRKDYHKRYYKVYYILRKEEYKIKSREKHLRRRYGINSDIYNSILKEQNFKCLVCDCNLKELKRNPDIDHNHKTGEVRGILCSNCNVAIGLLKEDTKLIKKALLYLEHNKT